MDEQAISINERELGKKPIISLFLKYSLITLVGMLAQSVMVIVEGIIIGNGLGTSIELEKMEKYILSAIENDMNIKIHTIGDKAIHLALNYFEKAEKIYGKKPYLQNSLEHLENI